MAVKEPEPKRHRTIMGIEKNGLLRLTDVFDDDRSICRRDFYVWWVYSMGRYEIHSRNGLISS